MSQGKFCRAHLSARLWELVGSVPVQFKIVGIAVGLILLLGSAAMWQMYATLTQILTRNLEARGISIGRDLAARSADLVLTNDLFRLYELVRDTVETNADVRYAFVVGSGGEVLVHSFPDGFPVELLQVNPLRRSEPYRLEVLLTEEGLIRDVAVPVFEGRAGVARVGLSERSLRQVVGQAVSRLALTTAMVAFIGIVAAYALTRAIAWPILELVQLTRAVAEDDLSVRARVWANDEVGRLQHAFNAMVEELARNRQQSERLWQELKQKEEMRRRLLVRLISVQEEERKRVARELHDETGQALTVLMIGLRTLQEAAPTEDLRARAAELRGIAASTLDGVHRLAVELRPSVLDDLGLVAALQRSMDRWAQQLGLAIEFQAVGIQQRLPPEVEVTLYRIIQEALTNVARHAKASNVSVLLENRGSTVMAIVEDDGVGFDPDSVLHNARQDQRLGLYGMMERASLAGGKLVVESRPGAGTTVFVEIPLRTAVAQATQSVGTGPERP